MSTKTKKAKKKTLKPKVAEPQEKPLLNEDIFRILSGLGACQNFKGRHFSYMIAENALIIQAEIDKQEKSIEVTDEIKDYREKLSDLRDKYKIIPGVNETDEYKTAEKALSEEYKEHKDKFNKERDEMLKDKSNIKLFVVDLKHVPEEICGGLMADIFECIKK